MSRDTIVARYRSYLAACNRRDWDSLVTHLSATVRVNSVVRTQREYVADLGVLLSAFPDYHWELVRAVVDGEWLAVHLVDTGTRRGAFHGAPADGSSVVTDEFAMYRWVDGLISEIEGTADNDRLRQ